MNQSLGIGGGAGRGFGGRGGGGSAWGARKGGRLGSLREEMRSMDKLEAAQDFDDGIDLGGRAP